MLKMQMDNYAIQVLPAKHRGLSFLAFDQYEI